MAYKLRNRQLFETTVNSRKFTFTCYTQSTSYGFRHVAFFDEAWGEIQLAKACYYNRTWERFTYETVLKKALANLLKYKDITKEEHEELYAILIDGKAQKEYEECEKQIQAFQALYEKTSDDFKERAKELPLMQSESDVQAVKGLMALDIAMNSGK